MHSLSHYWQYIQGNINSLLTSHNGLGIFIEKCLQLITLLYKTAFQYIGKPNKTCFGIIKFIMFAKICNVPRAAVRYFGISLFKCPPFLCTQKRGIHNLNRFINYTNLIFFSAASGNEEKKEDGNPYKFQSHFLYKCTSS